MLDRRQYCQCCLLEEIDKTYTVDLIEQEQWLRLQSGSVRVLINYFWQCSLLSPNVVENYGSTLAG